MAAGIIGVGLIFSAIFHIGVREPPVRDQSQQSAAARVTCLDKKPIKWYQWFKNPQFYMVSARTRTRHTLPLLCFSKTCVGPSAAGGGAVHVHSADSQPHSAVLTLLCAGQHQPWQGELAAMATS